MCLSLHQNEMEVIILVCASCERSKFMKKPLQNNKHLSFRDRIAIQAGIETMTAITKIAYRINCSRQTIYDEIKNNAVSKRQGTITNGRLPCPTLKKLPFVCNLCTSKVRCRLIQRYYYADEAHQKAHRRLKNSRSGTLLTHQQLQLIEATVSPLIRAGQSVHHICNNNILSLPICERSVYNLIHRNELSVRRIDLRRTVQRAVYTSEYIPCKVKDPLILLDRTYADFLDKKGNFTHHVQFDTVHGKRSDLRVILTIFFPNIHFMFGILLEKNSPELVLNYLRFLQDSLGSQEWKRLFPVLLCDNGFEFNLLSQIEYDQYGEKLSSVFYADPYRSTQKAGIESNHRLIRYVIPKSTSLESISQEQLNLLFSHINSFARQSLADKTPYRLAKAKFGISFLKCINIIEIASNKVYLRPDLFTK